MENVSLKIIINYLSKYFKNYYDVTEYETHSELNPVMRCDLHVANQKYFLFKSAVIWTANCHEYIYVFKVKKLTHDIYMALEKYVYDNGMELIHPDKEHMYTYLTLFVVAEEGERYALNLLRKSNRRKDFKFSLHGWMELHTAAYICGTGTMATNRSGREYKKLLKNIHRHCSQQ